MKNRMKGTLNMPKQVKSSINVHTANKGFATAPITIDSLASHQNPGLGTNSLNNVTKSGARQACLSDSDTVSITTRQSAITSVADLKVSIVKGDDNDLYYILSARGQRIVKTTKSIVEKPSQIFGELTRIGIIAVTPKDKNDINKRINIAQEDIATVVATSVGFEKLDNPRYYIFGDGTVITPYTDISVVPMWVPNNRIKSSGDMRNFENAIAGIIRNQPVPLTLFFFALTPLVKPFVSGTGFKAENAMIELVGPSSTYKSALVCTLAGSIWGNVGPGEKYAHDWNMSAQKIEDLFLELNDHLLILDEATLAHTNDRLRAEKILNTVHRLSSGQGRARSGMASHMHSLAMMSTSNQPIREILPASEDVQRALEVRLISFSLAAGAQSFFETTPEGYSSVKSAMDKLFTVTSENYGLLAKAYIAKILCLAKNDRDKLTSVIEQKMRSFIAKIGLDESSDAVTLRRAQVFALIYATAVLAFRVKILRKKHWGQVRRSIRNAWAQYGCPASTKSGDARIDTYFLNQSNQFFDARGKTKPSINDKKFAKLAGIVFTGRGEKIMLAVPYARKANLGISAGALKELKQRGILRAGKDSLQAKRHLRDDKTGAKRDTCYIFEILAVPPNVNFIGEKSII